MDILAHKQSKTLKTYVEKVSELILKGKTRLCQLTGINPAEIALPSTTAEIALSWAGN